MSKPRFQITAVALMFVILTGLIFFVRHRESHPKHAFVPPVQMPDSPSNTPPKMLHIEGCDNDIPFTADEDIEPRITPGTTLDKLRAAYGKESKQEERFSSYVWTKPNFELMVYDPGATHTFQELSIHVGKGKKVTTPDAIVLGEDTYSTLLQKTKAHGINVHKRLSEDDRQWVLTVWFPSRCNAKYISEYNWILDSSPTIDKEIEPSNETQKGKVPPYHSQIFGDQVATSYHIQVATHFDGDVASPLTVDD